MRLIERLGAGKLTAKLYRKEDESYCFDITRDDGQCLRPSDLKDLIKLGELIAFHVLDDGWSTPEQRDEIRSWYRQLDRLGGMKSHVIDAQAHTKEQEPR